VVLALRNKFSILNKTKKGEVQMKAVVYEEYAPDDDFKRILQVKDVEDPKPKPNEVVFQVKAAALNYNDIWGMRGNPIPVVLPHISGSDAAGEVIAVGEDVTRIKVGDRVVSHSNMSCRVCSACRAEFVLPVLTVVSMTVTSELSGASRPALCGVGFRRLRIFRK
jgi:NADPH:quinone reductase-like Zn-dependent oxidoreductase